MASGSTVDLRDVVELLCFAAERAAMVAREVRSDRELLELLVRQKDDKVKGGAAPMADFKTLTDVFVQETVRWMVSQRFPGMAPHFRGEESPLFTSQDGKDVTIAVGENPEETAECLSMAMGGHRDAAARLAAIVHGPVDLPSDGLDGISGVVLEADVGIWIDPIDCTSAYINAAEPVFDNGICTTGALPRVTVLIGAYDVVSGLPLAGIVGQPFHHRDAIDGTWSGRLLWGVCDSRSQRAHNVPTKDATVPKRDRPLIVKSKSDKAQSLAATEGQFDQRVVGGAGYKLLCVIDGVADAFYLSLPTTFKWDTCGPHAVLRALGGDLIRASDRGPITYHTPDFQGLDGEDVWANHGGLFAFASAAGSATADLLIGSMLDGGVE